MRELVILSTMIIVLAIPIGVAHAQMTYVINIPTGAADPNAPYFWQVEATGNTDGIVTIEVGDTVRWKNADTAAHTVTSGTPEDGPDEIFDSSLFAPGQDFSHTFDEVGDFDYFCLVHPWMVGTISVTEANQGKILENVGSGLNNGVGFDIHYTLDRHLESIVEINPEQKTLTFTVAGQTENDQLEIRLPEGLIKNPNAVWVDDIQITDYTSEKQGDITLMIIPLEHNSERITIMGTQVIPEFGSVVGIVLVLSIVAVIMISYRSQRLGITKL